MEDLPAGYGVSLLQSLLALVAVSLLAWVVLRLLARTGFGQGGFGGGGPGRRGRIEVLERRVLDARRMLWIVRVGGRSWLLGAGESGAPEVLAELDPADLADAPGPENAGGAARSPDRDAPPTR